MLRQYCSLLFLLSESSRKSASTFDHLGTQKFHVELEQVLAGFLGVESTIAFGMVSGACFLV